MLTQILAFLLETFLGLFVIILLLRFWLQTLRAPARNPVSHFLYAATDWIVVPARRIIPGLFSLDLSTLLLAWLAEVLLLSGLFALGGQAVPLPLVLVVGVLEIVKLSLYILMFSVIAQAVLSWVAPYSPAMALLNSMVRPFLTPFQRRIPTIGNVDISPLFLIVFIQILLFVVAWLKANLTF